MDKMKLAHDYAMKCVGNPNTTLKTNNQIVAFAWAYADEMQAEADKRKPSGLPDALKKEWKPDWSQAPDDVEYWRVSETRGAEWVSVEDGVAWYKPAPLFDYQGNWQDSLRKRPE